MHPALWVGKTGLDAQQTELQVISNNLANVKTVGFKKDRGVFSDLLYQTVQQPGGSSSANTTLPSGLLLGTGVQVDATQKIHKVGNILQTDNALDLAITGNGFFQITLPDNTTGYTRDGAFQVNANGNLVTSKGNPLTPAITVPANTISLTIGSDGTVSALVAGTTTPTNLGQIQLADFINPAGLQPIGGNNFRLTTASGTAQTGNPGANGLGSLQQGSLEASNVSIVEELVSMIETQRAYEVNSKAVGKIDEMLQFANQTL